MSDPLVLVAAHEAEACRPVIAARFPDLAVRYCAEPEALPAALAEVPPEIVFTIKGPVMPGPKLRAVLDAPGLRWVEVGGAGVDHLHPWPETVMLTNGAGVLSRFMGEYVLGAILMTNFGFPDYIRQMADGEWRQRPWTSIEGKTLLVVGLGRIGREVARRGRAVGMRVLAIKGRPEAVEGVERVAAPEALGELIPEADLVAVHAPLTEATRGLIDKNALDLMKPEAVLINCARGPVVDEAALVAALEQGCLRAAVLDVFDREPLPADSPLWRLPNVVVTPHVSDSVADWPARFAAHFCDNLARWIAGEPLDNVIDSARGY